MIVAQLRGAKFVDRVPCGHTKITNGALADLARYLGFKNTRDYCTGLNNEGPKIWDRLKKRKKKNAKDA